MLQSQIVLTYMFLFSDKAGIFGQTAIHKRVEKQQYPVIITRCGKDYMASLTKGESITLYAPGSDVSLEVAEGVKSGIEQRIHTDLTRFRDLIPADECFVSPVVELLCKEQRVSLEQEKFKYRIKIPHNSSCHR